MDTGFIIQGSLDKKYIEKRIKFLNGIKKNMIQKRYII